MIKDIPSAILPFKRTAWKPIVKKTDGLITDSKFAGTPYLKAEEDYPRCENCGELLQLFIQLNLDRLPEAIKNNYGSGLLQMFYCINEEPLCEVECQAFFPFAKSVLIRIVQIESDNASADKSVPEENDFLPRLIIGWKEVVDYPNWEERELLEEELAEIDWENLVDEEGVSFNEWFPVGGDKLAGYPRWIQSIEYPNCPLCGDQMQLVFQIDSDDNVPHMFGDVGCGHITQCKDHKDQLAFGWACS
jgi:uncharacterized protein YwqG